MRSYFLAVALVGCALAAASPSPSARQEAVAHVATIDFTGLRAQASAALQDLRDRREQHLASASDTVF